MARTSLRTIICGVPAGTLTQDENGLISFTYDHDYDGPALSTNIPVSNRTYVQQVMNPYLFGLLPDSEDQRTIPLRCSAISDSTVRAECSFVPKKMPTPSCIALATTAL